MHPWGINCNTFFFNKKITYSSSIFTFITSALNLSIKSMVFHLPYLKDSILYLVSTAFVLLLNDILISLMKSFQSWVLSSSSSSSSFFCAYIPATPPLRQARITMILLLISMILLLLRNNCISLYQSSNFVQLPSNHLRSSTMFFGIAAYTFSLNAVGTGTTDISVSICL